jgi:hypothetical protein
MNRKARTIIVGTVFALILLTAQLLGQGRGGGHAGGMGRVGPAQAPRAVFNSPTSVGTRSTFAGHPTHPTPPFVTAPGTLGPRIIHARQVQRGFIAPQPFAGFYSPYFWGPSYYPPAYIEPGYPYSTPPAETQSNDDLSFQVQRLSEQIEELRQEQALAAERQAALSAPPPPPPVPEPPPIPLTLVFRDGHRMMILNYAVVGQTLWVLDEGSSTRIPLSDLDVTATQNLNRGQGMRLRLPER